MVSHVTGGANIARYENLPDDIEKDEMTAQVDQDSGTERAGNGVGNPL